MLMPLRHAAWGANMNNASICAYGYGTAFTAPAMFHAMDNLGVAQYLTRLGLALGDAADARRWQAGLAGRTASGRVCVGWSRTRLVLDDPFELFVAQNFALDGLLYPLIYGSFVDDHIALQGGTAVAMLTNFMPEWHDEIRALDRRSDQGRRRRIRGQPALLTNWAGQWTDRAQAALSPIARLALGEAGETALSDAREQLQARCGKTGLGLTR